ncbi:hypothetical protein BWQ96_00058 [Gracilariopsis chorda]|uniref:Uncharacterized protein n=1 Tax=Gracilariopsis chorda TaxID=448386 RepID=A0A2V3J648_9FLOR|nr:hypothetical protein BWQ96_00058 [Gracilariopsis chorda]|eukprot:PXF49898.1 hypothetical protein BWQ96_00058 [Gracilariopsis chorda]
MKTKRRSATNEVTYLEQGSRLQAAIQDLSNDDANGFFFAIDDSIQEIDTQLEAVQTLLVRSEDDADEFQATDNLPASCAVDLESHMFTAAEVSQALHRDDTGSRLQPVASSQGSSSRSKRRFGSVRSQQHEQLNPGERGKTRLSRGMFGSRSTPIKWSLSNYLQSVASTREKRLVAVSAWLMSLAGLIISLAFVTKDFLASKEELASTIRYEKTTEIQLPTLHFCTTGTQLPPFAELPNGEYQGQPLVWLDFIKGTSSNVSYIYPETKDLPQVRVESYTSAGDACTALKQMDPAQFEKENTQAPACFHCFTVDRSSLFQFKEATGSNAGSVSNKFLVRVSQHALVSRCRKTQFGLPFDVLDFFRSTIAHHAPNLKVAGIVDYGDYNPTDEEHRYILWPSYRRGFKNKSTDTMMLDMADMFCNVYMFSGYFYPSTSPGIKYRFNSEDYTWVRTGAGPYYPQDYNLLVGRNRAFGSQSHVEVIGNEVLEERAVYPGQHLFVMTNYSADGVNDVLAVVPTDTIASLRLERNLALGKNESFQSDTVLEDVLGGDIRTMADVYVIDVSMQRFLTKVTGEQQSVSWSAFIADFFGLTSLFLDVSVYTVIVSPLIVQARKRKLKARKRQVQAASGDVPTVAE